MTFLGPVGLGSARFGQCKNFPPLINKANSFFGVGMGVGSAALINKANSFWGWGWGVQDLASARVFPPLINKANSFFLGGGWGWVGLGSARFGQCKNFSPNDKQGKQFLRGWGGECKIWSVQEFFPQR